MLDPRGNTSPLRRGAGSPGAKSPFCWTPKEESREALVPGLVVGCQETLKAVGNFSRALRIGLMLLWSPSSELLGAHPPGACQEREELNFSEVAGDPHSAQVLLPPGLGRCSTRNLRSRGEPVRKEGPLVQCQARVAPRQR